MLVTALGLAWAVNSDGGVLAGGWYICLLMLGCAALLSWLPKKLPVERLHCWQEKSIALLLAYILLQTVPIPLVVLKLISPARAALVELAAPITGREYFSTLSAAPAATVECLLRLLAYCLVFFLIRELTLRTKGSWVWAPAIPLIVIGLWQAWLGQDQFASGAVVAGTYENRNHFSGLLEMILPCAAAYGIGLVKGDDGRTTTLAQLVSGGAILMAAAAMFIAILDSQSKTGFTAMLVSFLVM